MSAAQSSDKIDYRIWKYTIICIVFKETWIVRFANAIKGNFLEVSLPGGFGYTLV